MLLIFSLLTAFLDEAERKYVFECDSEDQCKEWIDAIIKARYVFLVTFINKHIAIFYGVMKHNL